MSANCPTTSNSVDAFGHRSLTGTARFLANTVGRRLNTKTRCIELATLQRCAGHVTSRTDITEAYQVGGAAVKAAFEGHTGEMVAIKRVSNAPYQSTTELHRSARSPTSKRRSRLSGSTPTTPTCCRSSSPTRCR